MRRRRIHLLEVGLVWPPETYLQWKLERLASRGFRVTVAGRPDRGEPRFRLEGVRLRRQPHWEQSRLQVIWGVLRSGLALALTRPQRLPAVIGAARNPLLESEWDSPWTTLGRLRLYLPLARINPDVVQFEWNATAVSTLPMMRVWRCPAVLACRGSEVNLRPYGTGGIRWGRGLRESFRRAAAVHCISEAIVEEAAVFGLDRRKVWVIPQTVDAEVFKPPPDRSRSDGLLRIVSVGDFRWLKGHEYSLQSLRRLLDTGVPAHLTILGGDPHGSVGEGSERGRLEYTIRDLGLERHVELRGRSTSEEVRAVLVESDVFLHSSLSEGTPTAMLEAMACELPIVIADVGGIREALTNGVEGFVLPVRDARAAADAVEALWRDPALARRMGEAGRRRALSQHTLEEQTDRFVELYEHVVATSGGEAEDATPPAPPAVSRDGRPPPCSGVLRVLSVGPLSWTAGYDYALHAVRILLDRGIDCEYRILGDGRYEEALWFARHQLGLKGHALFLSPKRERLEPLLDWADVLVDAAITDDESPAAADASAHGLPVVSTGGADGAPVPRRDPHALADRLAALSERATSRTEDPRPVPPR